MFMRRYASIGKLRIDPVYKCFKDRHNFARFGLDLVFQSFFRQHQRDIQTMGEGIRTRQTVSNRGDP